MIIVIVGLWFFVAWLILGTLLLPSVVGKPRAPLSGGMASFQIGFNLVLVVLLALAAIQLTVLT